MDDIEREYRKAKATYDRVAYHTSVLREVLMDSERKCTEAWAALQLAANQIPRGSELQYKLAAEQWGKPSPDEQSAKIISGS